MGSRIMRNICAKNIVFIVVILTALLLLFPFHVLAKVSGSCANCHTMHNSQDGNVVDAAGPNNQLLKGFGQVNYCVGCHSAASGATWQDAVTGAPIVWNQSEPTFNSQKGLAGGNFYWVSQNSDTWDKYGHNVYGIIGQDRNLNEAPGNVNCQGLTSPCHKTLAAAPQSDNFNKGGCEGCHYNVSHHSDNGSYRFLNGHESASHTVDGIEDPNWEYSPSQANQNTYKGYDGPAPDGATLATTHSISTFCGGCHHEFHRDVHIGGTSSPWVRHPTDFKLPQTGEYAGYDPTTTYSNEAPVAYITPLSPTRSGAVVMCLSCHRPHGSQNPDMLRWDYNGMIAGTSGATAGTGCFTCHTEKDGS